MKRKRMLREKAADFTASLPFIFHIGISVAVGVAGFINNIRGGSDIIECFKISILSVVLFLLFGLILWPVSAFLGGTFGAVSISVCAIFLLLVVIAIYFENTKSRITNKEKLRAIELEKNHPEIIELRRNRDELLESKAGYAETVKQSKIDLTHVTRYDVQSRFRRGEISISERDSVLKGIGLCEAMIRNEEKYNENIDEAIFQIQEEIEKLEKQP
ncbi:MAG: hypothetical protein RR211_02275 [Pseudoflavonifractor sp.]